jgi:hypothetical protein
MWMLAEKSVSLVKPCSKAGRSKKPARRIRAAVDAMAAGVAVIGVVAADAVVIVVAAGTAAVEIADNQQKRSGRGNPRPLFY